MSLFTPASPNDTITCDEIGFCYIQRNFRTIECSAEGACWFANALSPGAYAWVSAVEEYWMDRIYEYFFWPTVAVLTVYSLAVVWSFVRPLVRRN